MVFLHRCLKLPDGLRLDIHAPGLPGRILLGAVAQQQDNPAAGTQIAQDIPAAHPGEIRKQKGIRTKFMFPGDADLQPGI